MDCCDIIIPHRFRIINKKKDVNYIKMAKNYKSELPEIIKNQRMISIDGIYTMFEARRAPEFYFSGEYHSAWEMVYVCEGSVGITADEKIYNLSAGELIFHHPMQFHKIWSADGESPCTFICSFDISGGLAKQLKGGVYRLSGEQLAELESVLSLVRKECNTDMGRIGEINYAKIISGSNPDLFQMIISRLESFFMSLAFSDGRISPRKQGDGERLYTKIVELLEENVYSGITIAEIASRCGVSSATVKNCFSGYAGCGIHKYFLKIKIRTAMELLGNGKNVGEVSDILGFANPNYFSYVFKRETGECAGNYRKK